MGKTNNIIEINGKRYDARTGAALDGFELGASNAVPVTVEVLPGPTAPTKTAHPAKIARPDVHRKAAKHHAAHHPQQAKTLRRDTVAKPAVAKKQLKARGHTDALLAKPAAAIKPKSSAHSVNERRLQRASQASKSGAVKRFQAHRPATASIPVTVHKPAPKVPHHQPRHHQAAPRQVTAKPQTTAELLEHALQQATSHLEPSPATKRRFTRRKTSLLAATLATVVLVGFIAAQNVTNVQLRIASSKAGFTATLPEEAPAGYRLSHLNYSPGTVSAHYRSNSDSRSYAITEKTSQWDSNSLREEFLASNGHQYQTVESGGRTLYLYGQNAATWVSGGVWYQVQSNGALSSDQLVKLATSL